MTIENFNQMNKYLMTKKEAICIQENADDILGQKVDPKIVLGMAANLDTWGYVLSNECINKLMDLSEETVVSTYNSLVETLKEIKGDDVNHDTFLFKNFPDSCRTMTGHELSEIRFISYYTNFIDAIFGTEITKEIDWDGEEVEKVAAKARHLRTISLATEEDFKDISKNMLSSRMSLSSYDKEVLDFTIKQYGEKEIIPEEIPFKENWAYIIKKAFEGEIDYNFKFKTFTDFIRAGVALSDGDITLKDKPKFRKFKSSEQKQFLNKLNMAAKYNKEEFVQSLLSKRNQRFFINVLFKGWHVPLDSEKYKDLKAAWEESKEMYSYLSLAEQAIEKKDFIEAARQYEKAGAGYVIRHANSLMENIEKSRKEADMFELASILERTSEKTQVPVLLNARNALNLDDKYKVAFIKGSTAKFHVFENKRELSDTSKALLSHVYEKSIKDQIKGITPAKTIYIDERLKDCPLPFAQRNNNGQNRAVERGTKLPLHDDTKILRGFVYKKYSGGGFYDLSASLLNEGFELINQVSWTNLKTDDSERPMGIHSGDNSNCVNGCTECIDIDLDVVEEYSKKMQKESPDKAIRYVAFQVYAWNGVPFDNMDRVFFGLMERDNMASDMITEADMKRLTAAGYNYDDVRGQNNGHEPYYYHLTPEQLNIVKDYKPEAIFDPATVEYRYDLTGTGRSKAPMLYDIKEHKVIFADLNLPKFSNYKVKSEVPAEVKMENINLYDGADTPLLENNVDKVAAVCDVVVNMAKPTIYDYAKMVAEANDIEFVENPEEADLVFSIDKIDNVKTITPFDIEEISKLFTPEKAVEIER